MTHLFDGETVDFRNYLTKSTDGIRTNCPVPIQAGLK